MIVRPMTERDAQVVREWRNDCRHALRTGWTTELQQTEFVRGNMTGSYMYFGFHIEYPEGYITFNNSIDEIPYGDKHMELVAAGGLVGIDRRARIAEIALIVQPQLRGEGFGTECAEWILAEAFGNQNLKTVYGEVYNCGAVSFWLGLCEKYKAYTTELPNRQWWNGRYHDSMYFSFDVDKWAKIRGA